MRELSLEEIRQCQLNILDTIHKYCEQEGLTYYLGGGTLIGAIRHQGYIPWDDDIDLYMMRKDYEIFIQKFDMYSPRYKVYSVEAYRTYRFPFAKVCDETTILIEDGCSNKPTRGVYVDIFPVDYAPRSQREIDRLIRKEKRLFCCNNYVSMSSKNRGFVKNVARILFRLSDYILGVAFWGKWRNRLAIRCGDVNSNKVCMVMGCVPQREVYDKSLFEATIPVQFEGKMRNAPIGYDAILRQVYGDYMKLPPEEKRNSNHNFVAFVKNDT